MSFSSDTKREICQKLSTRTPLQYSELYAMLLLGREFTSRTIIFKTENEDVFSHFVFLISRLFKAKCEVIAPLKGETGRNRAFTVTVTSPEKCRRIFEHYGHEDRDVNLRVNRANIDDEEEQRAFIRGAFLACGSVTDPEKAYHLEFAVSHRNLCMDICRLVDEIQDCDVSPKMLTRGGNYIGYIKDSEQITDLLTYMGAVVAGRYNLLPEELKVVAQLRYDYPELTLRDLGAKLDPPISRSGVNHRLEKIIRLAEED